MDLRCKIYLRMWGRLPLPGFMRRWHLRGLERLRRHGRLSELRAWLARHGGQADHEPLAVAYLAEALLQDSSPDAEAVGALMSRPPAHTQYPEYWFCRARVYQWLGRGEEALISFEKALASDRSREEVLLAGLPLAARHPGRDAARSFLSSASRYPDAVPLIRFFLGQAGGRDESACEYEARDVLSVEEGASAGHARWFRLGAPEPIRLAAFTPDGRPAPDQVIASNVPYVAEITDATLVSGSSLVRVGASTALSDVFADWGLARHVCHRGDSTLRAVRQGAVLVRRAQPAAFLAEGINLSGTYSQHYGHWFAEYLPKLRHFIRQPRFEEVPIIVDAGMPASHYDFLSALVPNRLHILPRGSALRVGCLWVAPTVNFFPPALKPGHEVPAHRQPSWSAGALRFFSDRLRPGQSGPGQRRVFLSRRNSSWRRLANEQEIVAALIPLGFETVFLEELGFAEQLSLFKEAGFIVAPNGSALNNLIFASPRVKVVVLSQHNYHNWGGWLGPFQDLGFNPVFITGAPRQSSARKHADYSIPTDEVEATVRRLLAEA